MGAEASFSLPFANFARRSTASACSAAHPTPRAACAKVGATDDLDARPVEMGHERNRLFRKGRFPCARRAAIARNFSPRFRRSASPATCSWRRASSSSMRRWAIPSSRAARSKGWASCCRTSNLTNEPFVTYYNNDPRQIRDYQNYGRNFMAGITIQVLTRCAGRPPGRPARRGTDRPLAAPDERKRADWATVASRRW